jgi:hypothetical protein
VTQRTVGRTMKLIVEDGRTVKLTVKTASGCQQWRIPTVAAASGAYVCYHMFARCMNAPAAARH